MALVGIMGGTFNPIHLGHVNLAKAAYEQFGLDKVIFIPTGHPPHKKSSVIVSDEHRMKMVELAIEDYPYFEASDMEIKREGNTYTYDTLKELKSKNTQDEIYFIIGADSLFNLEKWFKPSEILKMCVMVAADRDDIPEEEFQAKIDYFNEKYSADIRPLKVPMMDISSTEIRNAMRDNNLSDKDNVNLELIDSKVLSYIKENKLYAEK